jgi:predicted phage tail protein
MQSVAGRLLGDKTVGVWVMVVGGAARVIVFVICRGEWRGEVDECGTAGMLGILGRPG